MDKFTPAAGWDWDDNYQRATLEQTTPHGVFRAKIERDEYPDEPENDGGCPVVRIDTNRGHSFDAKMTEYGSGYDDGLGDRDAAEILTYFHERTGRQSGAIQMFARYLRIFHDGNLVEYGQNQATDYLYVAYVTRGLREAWGNTDDVKAELDEYVSWLEGDVYGVGVERATSFDDDDEPDGWTETEEGVCWGHYGEEWAKQAAEEALASEIKHVAAGMLPV